MYFKIVYQYLKNLRIQNLKMDKYFNFVLIPSNSNGSYKPQKEIFLQALKQSNAKYPHDMTHIGDSVELDYNASKNCGFNSILVIHDKTKIKSILNNNENKYEYKTSLMDLETCILTKK